MKEKKFLSWWWLSLSLFVSFNIFVILHNVMYGVFDIEEPIFFILALITLIGFALSVFINLILLIIKTIKKEIIISLKLINLISFAYIIVISLEILSLLLNIIQPGILGVFSSRIFFFGLAAFIFITLIYIVVKKQKIDERMEMYSRKAIRITFFCLIAATIVTMIVDGVSPIKIPISMFLSYFLTGILAVYVIIYTLLLKLY